MKKLLRNENGLSLAELLATLAIGSMLVILIMSIHILIQKQYNSQSENMKQLTDVTIAAKAITKDLRTATSANTIDENTIEIKQENATTTYTFENNVIKKNDADYIYEIEKFEVSKENQKITINIISESGRKINTAIMLREGLGSDK